MLGAAELSAASAARAGAGLVMLSAPGLDARVRSEIVQRYVPNFDWSEAGLHTEKRARDWERLGVKPRSGKLAAPNLSASIILPQGRNGPAFLGYPNYRVFFEWNQSFVYVTTAAYFATRLEGASVYDAGDPSGGLGREDARRLLGFVKERHGWMK